MMKTHVLIGFMLAGLMGCTRVEPHMSVEPYVANDLKRNAVEQIAADYCAKMRAPVDAPNPAQQPDDVFTSDGCTAWPNNSWLSCCIVHDITYWCGGSEQNRKEADQYFEQCVNNKMQVMGNVMYSGVRIGGSPWLPTPWRWGYGWKHWPNGYVQTKDVPSVQQSLDALKVHDLVERQLSSPNTDQKQ